MKAVILLALLVAACHGAQVICPAYTCNGKGKVCGVTYNGDKQSTNVNQCSTNLGCVGNFTLGTTWTGLCTAAGTLNQACGSATSAGCVDDLVCTSGTCQVAIVERYPGQSCTGTAAQVCQFNDGTLTNVNTCTSGTCMFTADNMNCTGSEQCNSYTSYCNRQFTQPNGVCTPFVALGAACNLSYSGICGWTAMCMPNGVSGDGAVMGKCGNWYSGAAGAACTSDISCNGGLYCADATGTNSFGVCTAPAASTTLHKACVDSTSCAKDVETCGCNSKYAKTSVCLATVNTKDIQKAYNNFASCALKNKCLLSDDACVESKCRSQSCAGGQSDLYNPSARCGSSGICGSGSSVVASIFLVATFAAFLLF